MLQCCIMETAINANLSESLGVSLKFIRKLVNMHNPIVIIFYYPTSQVRQWRRYSEDTNTANRMCLPKIHSKGCHTHAYYRVICDHSQSNDNGVNLHLVNGQGHLWSRSLFSVNVQWNIMFPQSILKCYLCKYRVLHKMICSLQFPVEILR